MRNSLKLALNGLTHFKTSDPWKIPELNKVKGTAGY